MYRMMAQSILGQMSVFYSSARNRYSTPGWNTWHDSIKMFQCTEKMFRIFINIVLKKKVFVCQNLGREIGSARNIDEDIALWCDLLACRNHRYLAFCIYWQNGRQFYMRDFFVIVVNIQIYVLILKNMHRNFWNHYQVRNCSYICIFVRFFLCPSLAWRFKINQMLMCSVSQKSFFMRPFFFGFFICSSKHKSKMACFGKPCHSQKKPGTLGAREYLTA